MNCVNSGTKMTALYGVIKGSVRIQIVSMTTSSHTFRARLASAATKKNADIITRLNYLKIVLYNIFIPNS